MYGTTGRRPPFIVEDGNHSSSDDSSSLGNNGNQFQAFRPSLFVSLQSPDENAAGANALAEDSHNDTLPSLQDRSWIGARMSPILNENDDDDDNDNDNPNNRTSNDKDDYCYARLQPPSSINQHQQQTQFNTSIHLDHQPSAGHQRKEYPPFGLHPLHTSQNMMMLQQQQQHQGFSSNNRWRQYLLLPGTIICVVSGLCLLGMGLYDLVGVYYVRTGDSDSSQTLLTNNNNHAWSLPWGQPSLATSVMFGGLTPPSVLLSSSSSSGGGSSLIVSYGRLVSSALQTNSVVEYLLIVVAWFVCQRPSLHRITSATVATIYCITVVTGQLWMLAVWWMTCQSSSSSQQKQYYYYANNNTTSNSVVAHCAAWGTCGVLCFVGMVRPQRRFGCFMICIGLVLLSLLQALWIIPSTNVDDADNTTNKGNKQTMNPLPLVVGCTASCFMGWALYGSQMIGGVARTNLHVASRLDQLPMATPTATTAAAMHRQKRPGHSGIRLFCAIVVVMSWIIPLLVLAYFDYYYFYYGERQSSSKGTTYRT